MDRIANPNRPMKKFLLLLAPAFAMAQLSGDYVIGQAQPAPFNKLTSAVAHLNSQGVSGPVAFLLDDNQYSIGTGESFPLTINQFAGSSAANTFTIRPNQGKTVLVKADNINDFTPTPAVFRLNGADYVTIDGSNNGSSSINMVISNTNALTYSKRAVIWLSNASATNGANHNTFKNLELQQASTAGAWSMGLYAAGTAMNDSAASAPNSNNSVNNVTFTRMGQGVYVFSSAAAANQSLYWTVEGCRFGAASDTEKGFLGIYLNNVKNYTLTRNVMDGFLKTTTNYNPVHAAIYTTGACSNGTISYNNINNVRETVGSGAAGIYSTGANTIIYNNMVNNVRANGNGGTANNGFGIVLAGGVNVKLWHNSVRLTTAQSSGVSAALYVASGSALDIRNNIFMNSQSGGPTRYAVYSAVAASAYSAIDHNNYSSQQHVGYLSGNKPNLQQWKNATGKDQNSVSMTPPFVSINDLHIDTTSALDMDNLGTPIATVLDDIDADTRSQTPDLGADEFILPRCPATTTWNGSAWSNGAPNLNTKAVINADYSTASGNIKCCELVVNAGVAVTVQPNDYIEAEYDITVNGTLLVRDKGALVQNDESATHSGIVTVKRKTTPLKQYDYTYWASPVAGATLSVLATPSLYYLFNPAVNNYVQQTAATVMAPARGYIARAPSNLSYATPQIVEATFNGIPNTGTVPVTVNKSAGAFNLIGNPYPSAIDADMFLTDPDNAPYIGGTIYLWTHNTAISMQNSGSNLYNYTRDDYAKYNVTGGVKTATAAVNSAVAPVGKIASGQGFFIEALQDGDHQIFFKNAMRATGQYSNGQFFRSGNPVDSNNAIEKNRIWLSISNAQQAYDEMLLGYVTGATNELDRAFDGKTFPAGNVVAIYSLLGDTKLAIQGRALPFSVADAVPIGYMSTIAGTFDLKLEQFDGFFEGQDVFLLDHETGQFHDLRTSPYSFVAQPGTNNTRFELRFTTQTLSNPDAQPLAEETVILAKARSIAIRASQPLKTVEIFDMTGKKLFHEDIKGSTQYQSPQLQTSGTAVLVIATFETSALVSRKIVILEP